MAQWGGSQCPSHVRSGQRAGAAVVLALLSRRFYGCQQTLTSNFMVVQGEGKDFSKQTMDDYRQCRRINARTTITNEIGEPILNARDERAGIEIVREKSICRSAFKSSAPLEYF